MSTGSGHGHRHKTKSSSNSSPDILNRSQGWVQKVSSIRLSNLRLGYQLTSLIGDREKEREKETHSDLFVPLFTKVIQSSDCYFVALGGWSGFRLWQIIDSSSTNSETSTDLIYEDHSISCLDCCLYNPKQSGHSFALLLKGNNEESHRIQILTVDQQPRVSLELEFEGNAEKILATNLFLLVAVSPGFLRIFCGDKLHPVTEIPSLLHAPVVFATSHRWIAVQISQKDLGPTPSTTAVTSPTLLSNHNASVLTDTSASSGDAARRVVSGLYTLSKLSWQAVQPLLKQAYAGPPPTSKMDKNSAISNSVVPDTGGGILILDLGSYQHNSSQDEDLERDLERKNTDDKTADIPIITQFVGTEGVSLGVTSFSPTGLKLASADINGQVILVHALVPSGLMSHSHRVVGLNTSRPYLLYKLVRGLTLTKIVDLGFDHHETIAFAASVNGTLHIFDLSSTSTESSELKSAPSSWSRSSLGNSLSDTGSSPLNPLTLLGLNAQPNSHPTSNNSCAVPTESHAPLTDVSHFLQLHRPDLRTLHGYSEAKIKIPLREVPFLDTSRNSLTRKDRLDSEDERDSRNRDRLPSDTESTAHLHMVSTPASFFHEVNLISSTFIMNSFRGDLSQSAETNQGKYDMWIGTSEGLLSRFVFYLKSSLPLHSNQPGNIINEVNRWDLCTPLSIGPFISPSTVTQNPFSTSWVASIGHRNDHIIDLPPVWMRPQCHLRLFQNSTAGPSESNSSPSSLPIPIEKTGSILRQLSTMKAPTLPQSTLVLCQTEKSDKNTLFFPERRSTKILKVDHRVAHPHHSQKIDLEEKIHSALSTSLPEKTQEKHGVVITRHIDELTTWEMDEEWEGP